MFEHLLIGRYIHKQSFVHRLDPRTKLVGVCLYILLIFVTNSISIVIVQSAVLLVLFGIARLSFYFLWQGLKVVLPLITFIGLISLVSYQEGYLIGSVGPIEIYSEGIQSAILLPARFSLLIFSTSLLTLTTSSMELAFGFARILRPLQCLGFPSEQFSFMLTVSIRFIPTFLEELDIIVKAQTARGSGFNQGNMANRMKSFVSLIVLSMLFTIRRAEQLALALESRCYRGGVERNWRTTHQMGWRDGITAIVILFLIMITIIYELQKVI
ncbi:energy-coupling factor transporter transmembrane component T family protein [Paenibacillus harenae]|uniref:energy-coupling factor transporter transmembrane component T family protein n=1 Tax=Paenibacillus harenae TaxID=306543 RepID=UPI000429916A|nr:energy-coupling factor transporter transmembrane component T [Paenibacillus harenae]